jgi:hypothetical protein
LWVFLSASIFASRRSNNFSTSIMWQCNSF